MSKNNLNYNGLDVVEYDETDEPRCEIIFDDDRGMVFLTYEYAIYQNILEKILDYITYLHDTEPDLEIKERIVKQVYYWENQTSEDAVFITIPIIIFFNILKDKPYESKPNKINNPRRRTSIRFSNNFN